MENRRRRSFSTVFLRRYLPHTSLLALVAVLLAGVPHATAAETGSETAKRYFEEGTKHFQLGEFDEAIESYRAGFKAKSDPIFLYNIAQAYRLKHDFQNAL